MQRLSPRFRSQQFFFCKICGETCGDLYGDAMLVPIRMGTNMATGNQQNNLSLCSVTEFCYKRGNVSLQELKND